MENVTASDIMNSTLAEDVVVNPPNFGFFTPEVMSRFFVVVYAGIYPIIFSFGIFGNILTLIVLSKENDKSSTQWFLVALTSSDLCFLLIYTYYALITDLKLFTNVDVKYLLSKQFLVLRYAQLPIRNSKFMTAIIVIERVFAVWNPLHVRSVWTPKRAIYISLACAVAIVALTSPTLTPYEVDAAFLNDSNLNTFALALREMRLHQSEFESFHVVTSVIFNILPVIIVVVCNSLIIIGIRRRSGSLKNAVHQQRVQMENKVTKTLLFISFLYFFLSVPYDILYLVMILDMEHSVVSLNSNTARFFIFNAYILVIINSSINFIIYVTTNDTYREKYR
ncbi:hypothetical protein FSP39_004551 [Pinctada imbricata]|uniref:G-protein coupled receptors family 1 profile domain-containing protein n=1 Tax=Pinctada imbricata TaxID=66713 RepID=A0AA89BU09_PINIB|nr:hypothetical protein FSP39_004551 [Pinctada imbricata]